jgi:hypothetical protein
MSLEGGSGGVRCMLLDVAGEQLGFNAKAL